MTMNTLHLTSIPATATRIAWSGIADYQAIRLESGEEVLMIESTRFRPTVRHHTAVQLVINACAMSLSAHKFRTRLDLEKIA